MEFEKIIFVECNPDELLIQKIGIPKKIIYHAGGKTKICKKLSKDTNKIGVIDEDPLSVQPPYIKKLKIIEEEKELGIKVLFDEKRKNRIIILSPRLEEWIIKACEEAKIDLKKYNLPKNGNKLHKVINTNLNKFENLLGELIGNSKRLICFKNKIISCFEKTEM